MLDALDKRIIEGLQGGFPISERPYAEAALAFGIEEQELIARIARLLEDGVLSRFGPMYNADKMGGEFCLCAVAAPIDEKERAIAAINAHPEVAHNYERRHRLNIWFVLATPAKDQISKVVREIEAETGFTVFCFPKLDEYFISFKMEALG
jgi:DNA-binding Lrp family transcriptional regulator